MKSSGDEKSESFSTAPVDQERLILSSRKLAANRENALKSTGPRTERGKAFSRMNSWKHGLFARHFTDFLAHGEDPDEYDKLLEGLREQHQPVGRGEELEVERTAQCWWRLKRAYRYENAEYKVAQRNIGRREWEIEREYCRELERQEAAAIQLLQNAADEIDAAAGISDGLKAKLSELLPGFERMWRVVEEVAQGLLEQAIRSKLVPKPNSGDRASITATMTAHLTVLFLKQQAAIRIAAVTEIANAQHVIPNHDVLDRLLRYEPEIERSLGRALDRLERLQERRRARDESSKLE